MLTRDQCKTSILLQYSDSLNFPQLCNTPQLNFYFLDIDLSLPQSRHCGQCAKRFIETTFISNRYINKNPSLKNKTEDQKNYSRISWNNLILTQFPLQDTSLFFLESYVIELTRCLLFSPCAPLCRIFIPRFINGAYMCSFFL